MDHIGLDVHKRESQICILAQGGEKDGDDQAMEDRRPEGIRWPEGGDRLFEIASFAGSSQDGWFAPKWESSSVFLRRTSFGRLGGDAERFDQPGGVDEAGGNVGRQLVAVLAGADPATATGAPGAPRSGCTPTSRR